MQTHMRWLRSERPQQTLTLVMSRPNEPSDIGQASLNPFLDRLEARLDRIDQEHLSTTQDAVSDETVMVISAAVGYCSLIDCGLNACIESGDEAERAIAREQRTRFQALDSRLCTILRNIYGETPGTASQSPPETKDTWAMSCLKVLGKIPGRLDHFAAADAATSTASGDIPTGLS